MQISPVSSQVDRNNQNIISNFHTDYLTGIIAEKESTSQTTTEMNKKTRELKLKKKKMERKKRLTKKRVSIHEFTVFHGECDRNKREKTKQMKFRNSW